MKIRSRRLLSISIILVAIVTALFLVVGDSRFDDTVRAQPNPTPTPEALPIFNQLAALAKLREQIKGKEKEPAETVFKNIQTPMFKGAPASRLLAVMEMGYARSLGVDCTHCHVPDKWESDDKPQKQIGREMIAMTARINNEMLKNIKNLKSATPTINCTTCHRGDQKPALNLPQ